MKNFQCPRCKEMSIPPKDKFLAGLWRNIHCAHCGAKLCAYPIPLAILYFFHTWNIVWFYGMYHFTGNPLHFLYMVLVWLGLEFIDVAYMPLAVMRGSKPKNSP